MARGGMWVRILVVSSVGVFATMAGAAEAGAVTGGHVAGYVAPPGFNPTQTAAVTLVVPTINCSKVPVGGFQAVLAGSRLETPAGNTSGGAALICPGGPLASYQPFIQINGVPIASAITVNPGDVVSVTLSEGPIGSTVTLSDGTQTQTASGPGGAVTSEDIGDIAANCIGSACSPVPKSKPTKFSAASVNSQNLLLAGAAQQYLLDVAGAPQITSTVLKKKTFDAFRTKWVQSCGVGPGRC